MSGKSYLIEYTRIGAQVKVTACDPDTGIEASVVVPATATQKEMSDLAVCKLQYVMNKKDSPSS